MLSHYKESLKTATVPYNICFSKIQNILMMRGILKIKLRVYFTPMTHIEKVLQILHVETT